MTENETPTIDLSSPQRGTTQISEALKERLRRSGRSHFKSPVVHQQKCDVGSSTLRDVCSMPLQTTLPALEPPTTPSTPVAASVMSRSCPQQLACSAQVTVDGCSPLSQKANATRRFHPFRSPILKDVSNTPHSAAGVAPYLTARRICSSNTSSCSQSQLSSGCHSTQDMGLTELMEEKKKLAASILHERDRLRKLTLVQLYRKKNDISSLGSLTKKWRSATQQLLHDFRDCMSNSAGAGEPKPTLKDVMDHYQIEPSLIMYDPENDSFAA